MKTHSSKEDSYFSLSGTRGCYQFVDDLIPSLKFDVTWIIQVVRTMTSRVASFIFIF